MRGGVVVTIGTFGNEAVQGIVPVFSNVRDEETLGGRGARPNIVHVSNGEKETYIGGKYPVNCTSGISRMMDMWVQWLMTVVRGANSTLTYGCPMVDERGDKRP